MSQRAIETLMREKSSLLAEKKRIELEIEGINAAIEKVSGRTVWEIESEMTYDDENPDYIKSSIEE